MEEQHRAEHHARQPCTSRVPAPRGSCILHLLCTQDELRFLQLYLGDIYYAALFYKLTWTRDPKISRHHLALCCKKGLGGRLGVHGTSAHPPGGNLGTFSLIFQPGINTQPRETELQLWPTGTDPILQKTDTSHTTASKRQHKSLKSSKQPKISNLTLIPVGNFLCKHTHTQRQTNKKAILLCQFYPKNTLRNEHEGHSSNPSNNNPGHQESHLYKSPSFQENPSKTVCLSPNPSNATGQRTAASNVYSGLL